MSSIRNSPVILLDVNMLAWMALKLQASFVSEQLTGTRRSFLSPHSATRCMRYAAMPGAVDYMLAPVLPEVLRSKVAVFVDLFLKPNRSSGRRTRCNAAPNRCRSSRSIDGDQQLAVSGANAADHHDTARDIIGSNQAITLYRRN